MSVLDAVALPSAILAPLIGALFALFIPSSDRVTLRHVAMATSIVGGLAVLWALASTGAAATAVLHLPVVELELALALSPTRLPAALVIAFIVPMAIRAGAPRAIDRTKVHVGLSLVVESAALLAVLAVDGRVALLALDAAGLAMFFMSGLFGGPHKATVALKGGLAVVILDALALFALAAAGSLPPVVVDLLLLGPVAARAGAFPLGVLIADAVEQGSVTVVALGRAVALPAAATFWVVHVGRPPEVAAGTFFIAAFLIGAALSALAAIVERDLRRFIAEAATTGDTLPLLAMFSITPKDTFAALAFLALLGAATAALAFALDALERRLFSRDSVELVGASEQLPALFKILLIAMLLVIPIPGVGAGALLVDVVAAAARATLALLGPRVPQNAALFVVLVLLLAVFLVGLAAVTHLRRLATPPRSALRPPAPFRFGHALRLWIPIVFVLLGGVVASSADVIKAVISSGSAP